MDNEFNFKKSDYEEGQATDVKLSNRELNNKVKGKSQSKQIFITILCITLFAAIIMCIVKIGENREYNENLNYQYDKICQSIKNQDYRSALSDYEKFKVNYSDNEKGASKISELSDIIETNLYENRNSTKNGIASCEVYIEYFSNGKYKDEMEKSLAKLYEKQSIENINTAKSYISKDDFLSADSLLRTVVNNTYVSEETKNQADILIKSIANKVISEKGKKAILGTWRKSTGVSYTFEENGHMSVSMSQNYNSSAGTTLDGHEVNSILSEIKSFGRIVRGGTWEYVGTQTSESGTVYVYSLFHYGSQYKCIISVDNSYKMGIYLSMGIGDMSVLTK